MSRKANPALIGAFVLAGIGLAVAAVLLITSARLFTKKAHYVLYFDDSLTGLDPGTAVKFRGVTIGSVKEILIHFNQQPSDAALPVIIELNENLLTKRTDDTLNLIDESSFQAALKRGLRGKLEAQSLLTGLLYVELDFLPHTAEVWHQIKPLYKEIPTAPTEVQIFRVDFAEVTGKLNLTLGKLDKSLSEFRVREISAALTNVLASINAVAASPELTNTIASAHETLIEVKELAADLRRRTDALSCSAESALAESRQTLREVRGGVQDVRDVLTPDGTLRRDLNDTLESLRDAAQSISSLADFLNKHPNALISGKRTSEAKP